MDTYSLRCAPIVYELVESFRSYFIDEIEEIAKGKSTPLGCLNPYLTSWVANPKFEVIEMTGGSFSTFLQAVTLIVVQFYDEPSYLFGDDRPQLFTQSLVVNDHLPACLDPQRWQEWVVLRQLGLPLES